MIEDFGARVTSVWEGLRPTTRKLIVGALQRPTVSVASSENQAANSSYDARADWELSRLLTALDERATETAMPLSAEQATSLRRMAETTARVLQSQTQSAEVFAQLVERAHHRRDYKRIDALADVLTKRFVSSEVCEIARNPHPLVRVLAQEALAQAPTSALISLLTDPVDAEIARDALERQATEYGSEEARLIVHALNQAELAIDDEDAV